MAKSILERQRPGGVILINSVLDGSAAYLMAANQMPKGVLDALDSRRRPSYGQGPEKPQAPNALLRG